MKTTRYEYCPGNRPLHEQLLFLHDLRSLTSPIVMLLISLHLEIFQEFIGFGITKFRLKMREIVKKNEC